MVQISNRRAAALFVLERFGEAHLLPSLEVEAERRTLLKKRQENILARIAKLEKSSPSDCQSGNADVEVNFFILIRPHLFFFFFLFFFSSSEQCLELFRANSPRGGLFE